MLSSAEAAALLAMIRTIAPHDTLDDAAYALVVKAIDADAAGSTQARTDLKAGIASSRRRISPARPRTRASSTSSTSSPAHSFSRCG